MLVRQKERIKSLWMQALQRCWANSCCTDPGSSRTEAREVWKASLVHVHSLRISFQGGCGHLSERSLGGYASREKNAASSSAASQALASPADIVQCSHRALSNGPSGLVVTCNISHHSRRTSQYSHYSRNQRHTDMLKSRVSLVSRDCIIQSSVWQTPISLGTSDIILEPALSLPVLALFTELDLDPLPYILPKRST